MSNKKRKDVDGEDHLDSSSTEDSSIKKHKLDDLGDEQSHNKRIKGNDDKNPQEKEQKKDVKDGKEHQQDIVENEAQVDHLEEDMKDEAMVENGEEQDTTNSKESKMKVDDKTDKSEEEQERNDKSSETEETPDYYHPPPNNLSSNNRSTEWQLSEGGGLFPRIKIRFNTSRPIEEANLRNNNSPYANNANNNTNNTNNDNAVNNNMNHRFNNNSNNNTNYFYGNTNNNNNNGDMNYPHNEHNLNFNFRNRRNNHNNFSHQNNNNADNNNNNNNVNNNVNNNNENINHPQNDHNLNFNFRNEQQRFEFRIHHPSNIFAVFFFRHLDFLLLFSFLFLYEYKFSICFVIFNKFLQLFFEEVLHSILSHPSSPVACFCQKIFLIFLIFLFYRSNLLFQPSLFNLRYSIDNQVDIYSLLHFVISYDLFLRVFSILLKTIFSFSSIFTNTFNEVKLRAFNLIDNLVDLIRYFVPISFWYSYLQAYSLGNFISCVYFLLKFNRVYLKIKNFVLSFFPLKIGRQAQQSDLERVDKCPICMEEELVEPTSLPCSHTFCHSCLSSWCLVSPYCPICRTPVPMRSGGRRSEQDQIVYIF